MLCHGELVRLRPAPRYLTSFYLMIAAGGALGGLSVSVVAPGLFNTYAEWKIGLVAGFVLAATVAFVLAQPARVGVSASGGRPRRLRLSLRGGLWSAGLLAALVALEEIVEVMRSDDQTNFIVLKATRSFYGVLTVVKASADDSPLPFRVLYNGSTRHGTQFTDPEARHTPTAYYSTGSGVGQTLEDDLASLRGSNIRCAWASLGWAWEPWPPTSTCPCTACGSTRSIPAFWT